MANYKLFNSDATNEKEISFLKKFSSNFRIFRKRKNYFKEYLELNGQMQTLVNDIHDIKEHEDRFGMLDDSTIEKLEALEYEKKILEKNLVGLEKNFYDVKKGLWIGIAIDLMSEDYEPFLLYLPWKNLYNHFEVYGTSGYGKSRLMASMIRQMILFGWSLMVIDPKGGEKQEVPQWVYDFAAEAGRNHIVKRIMPTFPSESDKGNVLFGLDDDEIASMTSSLTTSGSGVMTSDEQFFSGQVYRTTSSILAATRFLENAVYTKADINERIKAEVIKYSNFKERKNVEIIYEDENFIFPDVSSIAIKEYEPHNVKHLVSPFNRTLITFRELSYYSNYDRLKELQNLVKECPIDNSNTSLVAQKENALRILEDVTTKDKAFFEKVGDSLSVLLSQLAYGPIGSIMCDIRINPIVQSIRDKEGTIIIFQPAPMRFEKVSEMMIKCYTRMYLSLFGTIGSSGRGIVKRVAMIVDEAKPMMFPGIEEIYNKARQLGMTIGALYQSRSDPKFKLSELLADIVQDNTATSIFMKQVSESSRVECAESFGMKKIAVNVSMKENDNSGGRSSVIYEDKELVSSSDMDDLGIGEAYMKHYGKKYYVNFPYQPDPMNIDVVMPKLSAELVYEDVERIEKFVRNNQILIDNYNITMKEMKKGA